MGEGHPMVKMNLNNRNAYGLNIVQDDWVLGNYKETQIGHMRPGQRAALWELTQNPWVVLQTVPREKLESMLADPAFRISQALPYARGTLQNENWRRKCPKKLMTR
jgi:hypothetical protein